MNNLKKVTTNSFYQIKNKNLHLNDFKCKIIKSEYANKYFKYYEYSDKKTNEQICMMEFEIEPNAGKIYYLSVNENYRGKTLCTQMLNKVKEEVKGKTDKIWGISCSDDVSAWYENHKDDKTIKRIDRGGINCPQYEIYI